MDQNNRDQPTWGPLVLVLRAWEARELAHCQRKSRGWCPLGSWVKHPALPFLPHPATLVLSCRQ